LIPQTTTLGIENLQIHECSWKLSSSHGATATLEPRFEKDQAVARIEIATLPRTGPLDVQWFSRSIPVTRGDRILVRCRARADKPSRIEISITQNHAPWSVLATAGDLELTAAWQTYERELTIGDTEEAARLMFALGAQSTAVEFSEIRITRLGLEPTSATTEVFQPVDP
jgi:hypothetical protein